MDVLLYGYPAEPFISGHLESEKRSNKY